MWALVVVALVSGQLSISRSHEFKDQILCESVAKDLLRRSKIDSNVVVKSATCEKLAQL